MSLKQHSERLTFDSSASRRYRDKNGFLVIDDNPVAKAGIYEYLGREINAKDPNKVYKVYRPFDELRKMKESMIGCGITLSHEWVDPEEMPRVRGTIAGEIKEQKPYLTAQLKIMDAEAIDAVEQGKYSELSPGYTADYIEESGEYDGEHYDYVQRNMYPNHLALVEKGRTGKDLRVLDQQIGEVNMKDKKTQDFMDLNASLVDNKQTADEDKRKLIDEITAIAEKPDSDFEGGSEEKARTIIGLAERLAYKPSEGEERTDDEGVVEEEIIEEKPRAVDRIKKFSAGLMEAINDLMDEEAQEPQHNGGARTQDTKIIQKRTRTQDAAAIKSEIMQSLAMSQKAYQDVQPYTGQFNIYTKDGVMTEKDIYAYGYKCLGGDVAVADPKSAFKAYIAATNAKVDNKKTFDSNAYNEIEALTSHIQ